MATDPARVEAARQQLERVLASRAFARNERQSHFLRFLIERHLEGRDQELKESVLAVEVFGRHADYDPKLDAIVRTEAIRLRARLEKYYAGEGSADPLIIDLPKGGYRPVLRERVIPPETPPSRSARTWRIAGGVATAVALLIAGAIWAFVRPLPQSVSIAVLPIENLSHDGADDYFADGLTDELIRSLAVTNGLTVRSRTSSFALKGKRLRAADAGVQLGADYLVEGSVLHAGDQLRVDVELVHARDDVSLWSQRFDRKLTDIFAIQDEISRGVVSSLRLKLSPGRPAEQPSLEAYELYLRGRQAMESFPVRERAVAKLAARYFDEAIAKDPNYALAYAGLADTLLAIDENMGSRVAPDALPRAKVAAEHAAALEPGLSESQSALAAIRARDYEWPEAEQGFRRAIDANPNNALAHLRLGFVLLIAYGRADDGLIEVTRAAALDPLSPYMNTELGHALLLASHYPDAAVQLRKAIALDPTRNRAYNLLARALYLQGNAVEAVSVFHESVRRGAPPGGPPGAVCAEVRAGRRDQAAALLQEELRTPASSRLLAQSYSCLGNQDAALAYLEKMLADDSAYLPEMLQLPEQAWLRPNARFAALRRQVNLAP